jgi:nucleoside 2-deoxyribosyltransferase
VIGPIGDRGAPIGSDERLAFEQAQRRMDYVVIPACKAHGLAPVRADNISEAGEITEQVFRRLRDSDLVIADVTGGNPNVMYELGLRHTRDKATIQIGERDRLPFDVGMIRTIRFDTSETGLVEARTELEKMIGTALNQDFQPVTATRIFHDNEGGPLEDECERSSEDDAAPGFLDVLADAEEAAPLMSNIMEELTAVFEELPALTEDTVTEIEKGDAKGNGTACRLRAAKWLADQLEGPTGRIEVLAGDFVGQFERLKPGMDYLIGEVEQDPGMLQRDQDARAFYDAMVDLAEAAGESLPEVGELADQVQSLEQISNRLRPVSRRMATALRRISGTASTIKGWGERLEGLYEEGDNQSA